MLAILVALVVAYWKFQPRDNGPSRAADLVYCLAPAHRAGLVDAAVSLGFADLGSTQAAMHVGKSVIPVGAWQTKDGADFQRACAAYAAPAFAAGGSSAGDSGLGGILAVLIPLAAGSLLTLAADVFKQGSDRHWEQIEALRDSWAAFRGVVEAYAKARRRSPDAAPAQAEIDALRRDLMTRLRRAQSRNRKSPTIAVLKTRLTKELGAALAEGWAAGDSQEKFDQRRERADEITKALEDYDSCLQRIAEKLERGVWRSSTL